MSVTGHGAKTGHVRHADDWYSTPAFATRAILRAIDLPTSFCENDTIIDPCCGEGAILDVVAKVCPGAIRCGIELDEGRADVAANRGSHRVRHADALGPAFGGCELLSCGHVVAPPADTLRRSMEKRGPVRRCQMCPADPRQAYQRERYERIATRLSDRGTA